MFQNLFKKGQKTVSNSELEKAVEIIRTELLTDQFISTEATDAVQKLIDFTQSKICGEDKTMSMKDILIKSLASESYECLSAAYLYAKHFTKFGVDVTKVWNTATEQSDAMRRAYELGYHEGLEHMKGANHEY